MPISEALWLSNNPQVERDYLSASNNRLVGYLGSIQSNEELVVAASKSILSREPRPEEQSALVRHLESKPDHRSAAIGQVVWALLATPEFRFNH